MEIRKARPEDLGTIMPIYENARKFMRDTGNKNQWINGYPSHELIQKDIASGHCFVGEEDGCIKMAFAFIIGADPTYSLIEDGAWLNDEPYGTIHRIAGNHSVKGALGMCIDYCAALTDNLRVDTHADNKIMQKLMERYGFTYCGIIYAVNGTPRLAYQKKIR